MDRLSKALDGLRLKPATSGRSKPEQVYNVLVIGETQAGKSTLIQHMRKYADPGIEIDQKQIDLGFVSKTQEVKISSIETDLPEYAVKDNCMRVEYGYYEKELDENKYGESINNSKGRVVKVGHRLDKDYTFNLIDTPGLNAKDGTHEAHVEKIFKVLSDVKNIHLILVVVSSVGPITDGFKDALKAYADILPDLSGIIAVVHTKYDYMFLHPHYQTAADNVKRRMDAVHENMKRVNLPYFKIDCEVFDRKPIRDRITWNTIQNILELAVFNRPINMGQTVVHKTKKMRDIDNVLKVKFEATSRAIEDTLSISNKELADVYRLQTTVHELEGKMRVLQKFIDRHHVSAFDVLHEVRLDMDYENGDLRMKSIEFPEQAFEIDKAEYLVHNVKVIDEVWLMKAHRFDYKRKSSKRAFIHVRIYTSKMHLYRDEIDAKYLEQYRLKAELVEVKKGLRGYALQAREQMLKIPEIVDSHRNGIKILKFVMDDVHEHDVFRALVEAGAYNGSVEVSAKKVEAVYLELPSLKIDMNP